MTQHFLHRRQWLRQSGGWAVGATALISQPLRAAIFMTPEQALRLMLPDATEYVPHDVKLSADQLAEVERLTQTPVPKSFAPQVWQGLAKGQRVGWVRFDRVIGKYDWIDYAVAFDPHGTHLGLEVLAYRESHGGDIRQARWRQHFIGRKGPQSIRWGDDIRNISGSTLSCQHVTQGVQRLSAVAGMLS